MPFAPSTLGRNQPRKVETMEAAAIVEVHPLACPSLPEARSTGRTLLVVGAIGVAVSLLTWRVADAGAGWLAADAVLVVGVLAGVGRGRPSASQWILGAASLWLAGATTWYASDWALVTALPASMVLLAMLALASARRTSVDELSDLGGAAVDALRALPGSLADAAKAPVHAVRLACNGATADVVVAGARGHLFGVLRGALVGIPLAALFTLLLSADPRFRATLVGMALHGGDGLELVVWTAATTAGLFVGARVLARLQRPRDREALPAAVLVPLPYRAEGDAPAPAPVPAGPRVRALTWGVVLAHVVAVFGMYIVANAGHLFVGHAHLRAQGTVTYAHYLQEGFAQVSAATLLAVACVVLGHLLLRRPGGQRITGGRALVAVELALLSLVGVTLASCGHRLALYEEAYGYTYLRLGVWLLQLGVAGLLALTAARCLARAWRGWGTALVWSGVAFALVAGSVNADAWIARRNVDRARRGGLLDLDYLEGLSEDARGVLAEVSGLVEPGAADELAQRWATSATEHHAHGWRSVRGLGAP
jgi:two-component system sensor histidine kinase BaeS